MFPDSDKKDMGACDLSSFRGAIADTCYAPLSDACRRAAAGAGSVFGSACVHEPWFDGGPPLSLYVCPGADSALLRAQCGLGPGPEARPGPGPGQDRGHGPVPADLGVAGLGVAALATLHAGRHGKIRGSIGREIVKHIGTQQGKTNFIDLYAREIAKGLEQGTYRSNPLVTEDTFTDLHQTYNAVSLSDSEEVTRGKQKYQQGQVRRWEMTDRIHNLSAERLNMR